MKVLIVVVGFSSLFACAPGGGSGGSGGLFSRWMNAAALGARGYCRCEDPEWEEASCDEAPTPMPEEVRRCYDEAVAADAELTREYQCLTDVALRQAACYESLTCEQRYPRLDCGDGTSTFHARRCDGEADCSNGADEPPECDTPFICGDGDDVPRDYQCDQEEDCDDGSDERGCPPRTCASDVGDITPCVGHQSDEADAALAACRAMWQRDSEDGQR